MRYYQEHRLASVLYHSGGLPWILPSIRTCISLIHPLTHHGQISEYIASRSMSALLRIVMVKIPSIARGEVTVRCTKMGGGSIVRAVHQLDLLEMAYDIGIALRPAKRPECLCDVTFH
jgi:hypothetical protein